MVTDNLIEYPMAQLQLMQDISTKREILLAISKIYEPLRDLSLLYSFMERCFATAIEVEN